MCNTYITTNMETLKWMQNEQANLKKGRGNVTNIEDSTYHSMFISCQTIKERIQKDVWLLGSRCSNHMTRNKKQFQV